MASLTFADLKRMANDIVLSPPEAYMSSMCSEIKFKGFDSSPTFTTPIVEIAGFGIGPAKMGWKGEALASTDKLQVPVIPTDAMSEALEEVTVQIAKRVQENLVKWKYSPNTSAKEKVKNPVAQPADPKYKSTVSMKVPHAAVMIRGGKLNEKGDRVALIDWVHSESPLKAKSSYGRDINVAQLYLAMDDEFKTYTSKYVGDDKAMRQVSWGDPTAKDKFVFEVTLDKVWKGPVGITISITIKKGLWRPSPRTAKVEFQGREEVDPSLEQLLVISGQASASSAAAAAAAAAAAPPQVPLFEEDDAEEREAMAEFLRAEEAKEASGNVEVQEEINEVAWQMQPKTGTKRAENEDFPSPERAAPKSKKRKQESSE